MIEELQEVTEVTRSEEAEVILEEMIMETEEVINL